MPTGNEERAEAWEQLLVTGEGRGPGEDRATAGEPGGDTCLEPGKGTRELREVPSGV